MSSGFAITALSVARDASEAPLYRPPSETPPEEAPPGLDLMPHLVRVLGRRLGEEGRLLVMDTLGRAGLADMIVAALDGLGPIEGPHNLFLVQSGQDHAPTAAFPLAEVTERVEWEVREGLALTHLAEHGGTAVLDFADWAIPTGEESVVAVTDRPYALDSARGVADGRVVAMRLTHGPAPVRVVRESDTAAPDRIITGPGPCGAWARFAELVEEGALRPGERVALVNGSGVRPDRLLHVLRPDRLLVSWVRVGSGYPTTANDPRS